MTGSNNLGGLSARINPRISIPVGAVEAFAGDPNAGLALPTWVRADGATYESGKYPLLARHMASSPYFALVSRSHSVSNLSYNIAYGGGTFVIPIAAGTASKLVSSTDGVTWTTRTAVGSFNFYDIVYAASVFVTAVGSTSSADTIQTSSDAATWTSRHSPGDSYQIYALATDGTACVAVGYDYTNSKAITLECSTPTGTWTKRANLSIAAFVTVAYGGGLWVAGTNDGKIYTSSDRVTWTSRTSNTTGFLRNLTYHAGAGMFIAFTTSPVGIITSSDGVTWTPRTGGVWGTGWSADSYIHGGAGPNGSYLWAANYNSETFLLIGGEDVSQPWITRKASNGYSTSFPTPAGCYYDGSQIVCAGANSGSAAFTAVASNTSFTLPTIAGYGGLSYWIKAR